MNIKKNNRDSVTPEKEYVMDYVHQLCEPAGEMVFPLNGGTPLAAAGDTVLVGQKLSEGENALSTVHSSCSGTVKAVERRSDGSKETVCVVVENDRKFLPAESIACPSDWMELGRFEILEKIRMGGAVGTLPKRFPTAAGLSLQDPEDVSRIVVDGSEWEPYISSDDDVLRTFSFGVVTGLRILMRLFPGAEGVILIGENRESAVNYILDAVRDAAGICVVTAPEGRPLGDEKMIGRMLSGDESSVCVTVTPSEANAVYDAVCRSAPFIKRVVTVAGSAVRNPGNYLVRIGTSCQELLNAAGGVRPGTEVRKAVLGGALTGVSLSSLDVPVQKNTGALLLFAEEEQERETECIRCGKCAKVCPAGLMPMLLMKAAEKGEFSRFAQKLRGGECIECGACTWICPAKRPLSRKIGYSKTLSGG